MLYSNMLHIIRSSALLIVFPCFTTYLIHSGVRCKFVEKSFRRQHASAAIVATQRKSLIWKTGRAREKAGPTSVRKTFNCIICGITYASERRSPLIRFISSLSFASTCPGTCGGVIKSPPSSIRASSAPALAPAVA